MNHKQSARFAFVGLVSALWVSPLLADVPVSFRAVWADAFHSGIKSANEINDLVQRAVDGNYNAIIAEVLAFQDNIGSGHGAYWNSQIVPAATDTNGLSDPLAYLCDRAHANGIEVHAWMVTYRVCTYWPPSGNSHVQPEWISVLRDGAGTGPQKLGGYYFMDPGSPDVQEYLVSIVRELVTNYPIDGINWDYIRYTDPNAGYPADLGYENSGLKRFQRATGFLGIPSSTYDPWDDFRRRGIDELVRRCRAEIPAITSNPRQPVRHTADVFATGDAPSNLNFEATAAWARFQNWRLWMERGWLDAAIPMNYKRDHLSDQASWYRDWVDAAVDHWRYDRHIFNGQANYLNSMSNSVTQLQYCLNAGADGTVNYSYYATADNNLDGNWENNWSWYNYVSQNLFTAKPTVPPMPWRDPATAVEGTVWGRVFDAETGLPVDDATVQMNLRPAEQTDGNGYYAVTLLPASAGGTAYLINVTKPGLPSASHAGAVVMPGEVVRYDFYLGETVPGDFDRDDDVDQIDFGRMQACLSGSGNRQDDPECGKARLDDDTDVDQNDMNLFLGCMTGEGIPGDLNCAD